MNLTDKQAEDLGNSIINLLNLKIVKGKVKTSYGDKTVLVLGRTLESIIAKTDSFTPRYIIASVQDELIEDFNLSLDSDIRLYKFHNFVGSLSTLERDEIIAVRLDSDMEAYYEQLDRDYGIQNKKIA